MATRARQPAKRRKLEPKNVTIVQDTDGEDDAGASEDLEPRRKKRLSEAEALIAANAGSSKSASTPASKTVPTASKASAASSASPAGQPRPKAKPVPRRSKQAPPPASEAPLPPPPRSPTPPPSKISQHELVFHMPDPRTLPPNQRFLGRALPDDIDFGVKAILAQYGVPIWITKNAFISHYFARDQYFPLGPPLPAPPSTLLSHFILAPCTPILYALKSCYISPFLLYTGCKNRFISGWGSSWWRARIL
ncbi:hypothetical protein B0H11DRAFT_1929115 [Mycena galericulata]|nr:hypothetical protein B0H11DRAFT_1929115 [Mycena galericulata]